MRSNALSLFSSLIEVMTHMQHAKQQWHEYHIYILNTTQKFLIASHRYFTYSILLKVYIYILIYIIYTFTYHLDKYSMLNQVYTCMSSNKQALWYINFFQSWYRPYLFSFEMQQQQTVIVITENKSHS